MARDDSKEQVNTKTPRPSEAKNEDAQDLSLYKEVTPSNSEHASPSKNNTTMTKNSTVLQPADPLTRQDTSASQKPYSSYTLWEKRFIVFTATMGAFFSPFTAQVTDSVFCASTSILAPEECLIFSALALKELTNPLIDLLSCAEYSGEGLAC